ncbi:MAG: hypothetical protein K2H64_10085 [Desulfovibrio sp.]|nr:hypothetical protein [Desulfovibrio sp.]
MPDAHIYYIADVFCPWCYAFAPNMERLARDFPEFPVKVIGGNLISRPITLAEDVRMSPGLTDFWREVERMSGRSLQGAIDAAENGDHVLLFSPGADEILIALKAFAPGRELEQLIELETMFYGRGENIFAEESLAEIAGRWGVGLDALEAALDQPAALEATERNLAQAAALMGEITSYPSVLLVRDGKVDAVTRGYVRYETVLARFESAMADLALTNEAATYCSSHKACSLLARKL